MTIGGTRGVAIGKHDWALLLIRRAGVVKAIAVIAQPVATLLSWSAMYLVDLA